jgi:predicted metal-binding membrane protein
VALGLGALSLLATGVDHIQQYHSADYSSVPTIGTLFFLNFVSAVILAVGLVAHSGASPGATRMPFEPCSLWAGSGYATLLAAAAYELTPLKDICLEKCRSPLGVREKRRAACAAR